MFKSYAIWELRITICSKHIHKYLMILYWYNMKKMKKSHHEDEGCQYNDIHKR